MTNNTVRVMNQYVAEIDGMPSLAVTPLAAQAQLQNRRRGDSIDPSGSVAVLGAVSSSALLEESKPVGLLVLRAREAADALSQALQRRLSLSLPAQLQSASHAASIGESSLAGPSPGTTVMVDSSEGSAQEGHYCVRWMSPDEWLLSCPLMEAFSIESDLRAAMSGSYAVVNVSGGFTVLTLSGDKAQSILKKSTAYDIDECNFPTGKVVNTMMAKAQVTLRCVASQHYEIIVRTSFADYLWLWLQRAGAEYGMRFKTSS